jgi:hypothetical protein
MISNSPEVSNLKWLFLKLNWFICNKPPVLPKQWCLPYVVNLIRLCAKKGFFNECGKRLETYDHKVLTFNSPNLHHVYDAPSFDASHTMATSHVKTTVMSVNLSKRK